MGATQSAPGISVELVLAEADTAWVRDLLGEPVCRLLDLLAGGTAKLEHLRAVAASTCDFEKLLQDSQTRETFIGLLSRGKQAELAFRLDLPDSTNPVETLRKITWTKDRQQTLLGFFGFVVDRTQAEISPARRRCKPSYGLFPHQRSAAQRTKDLLYSERQRVVLHLPTGVGKTRTAMSVICDHLRERTGTLVVWLAHGRELLEQAATEFEEAWSHLGDRDLAVARMFGGADISLAELHDGFVALGVEKATAAARSDRSFWDELGSRTTLTIFDEAHQAIAPTYRLVTDALTLRPDAGLIGLTATPGRTWADISADVELADFFDHKKVMLELEGYTNPVTALIDQQYLARPAFRTVAADSGLELSDDDRQSLADAFELPATLLAELEQDVEWNLQVVRTVLDLAERHKRILVFASSVQHCQTLSTAINSTGLDCEYVTATTSTRRRAQAINRFKSRSSRGMVMCNFGVLTTGFDAPAASAAVIARPTKSLVLYSQMVGRVIRGPLAGGTDTCEIITVIDPSLPGFGDVAEAFLNWEDVWGAE